MAKDIEGQSIREYGSRKKRLKRRRQIIFTTLLLLFVIVGAVYLMSLYNRNYHSYEVQMTTEITGENAVGFLDYSGAVVKYSKDGAVAINKDGSLLWNGAFEAADPIADTSGKYVAVADRGGKSIHLFDAKGEVDSFDTLYNILQVEVSSQGVVAVLMEDGETNYITLYDASGTVLGDKATTVNNAGYPMDIDLSKDGEKLIVSYLSVSKGTLLSTIAFFNYGEVGQNYTDRFVGGYEFKDIVIPKVTFLDNDTVCVYKENGFIIYAMPEIPNLIHEENLEGNIKSVLHNEKYVGVVLEAQETAPRKLLLYKLNGEKLLDKDLDFSYDKIYLTKEEIIMHDNLNCLILKLNGRAKFRYTFDGNIAAFYPINDLDRYFLINEAKISEIALVE